MPAIVKLTVEALAEAIYSLNLEEMRQLQEMINQEISEQESEAKGGTAFLVSIAGLGASGVEDISERDEEILQNEVDPIHGWSIKPHSPS